MPQNYFITGQPKTGKTTLLNELVAELKKSGLKVGGFVSPEERHHGTRTAFQVMDVESRKKAQLANVKGDGPKVSKYHVDVKAFEGIAVPSMEGFGRYDVFVIDEIGVMEMKSPKFARLLERILESDTPLIATLHEHYIDTFRENGEILDLDLENRGQVYQRLLGLAKVSIVKKPARPEAREAPAAKPAKVPKAAKRPAPAKAPKAGKKPAKAPAQAKPKKAVPEVEMVVAAEPVVEEKEEAPIRVAEKPPSKEPVRHEEKEEEPKKEKKPGILGRLKKLFGG